MSYLPPAEPDRRRGAERRTTRRRGQGSLTMARGHGRRRRHGAAEEGSNERWLSDLRGHDHAADGVVHGAVLDLLGQHLQVPDAAEVAQGRLSGNILPGGKAIAQQGATDNSAHTPSSVELQAIEPVATEGSSSLQNSTLHGASAPTAASSTSTAATALKQAAAQNQAAEFARIKRELEAYAPRTASPRASRPRSKRAAWSSGFSPTICCSPRPGDARRPRRWPARRRSRSC